MDPRLPMARTGGVRDDEMTGYVHVMLDHHQDFPRFAWSCARDFGALVHMRDEPMDAPITYPEVSDYHEQALRECSEELERLLSLSEAEREARGVALRTNALVSLERTVREYLEKVARCRAMLAQVEAWEPPTPLHEGLKNFMREQLLTSIGNAEEYYPALLEEARAKDHREYFQQAVKEARWGIDYHTQQLEEERERVAERIAWLDGLKSSLSAPGEGR
jgi:hypothetical protein